jgi:hypothetical protein
MAGSRCGCHYSSSSGRRSWPISTGLIPDASTKSTGRHEGMGTKSMGRSPNAATGLHHRIDFLKSISSRLRPPGRNPAIFSFGLDVKRVWVA